MNPVAYEQILSLIGLIALWGGWYYLWKPQRVDIFRQRLFALRSDLFDLAADGVVTFDDPAYAQLRLLINGLIRFAHRASFATLMIALAQSDRAPSDPLAAWRKSVQKLPEDAREQILAVHKGVSDAFTNHLIGGSILLFLFVLLRILIAIPRIFLLLLEGKKNPHNFNLSRVRSKMEWETSQIAKSGTNMIEARVLHEEQCRASIKRDHAYAH